MANSNILSVLITVPLVFSLLTWLMPKAILRLCSVFGSIIVVALSVYELMKTGVATGGAAIEQRFPWVPELGLSISLRLDSVSGWFVVLNAIVALLAFSLRGNWFRKNPKLFVSFGFFLVMALNAAFLSTDLIFFYLAYEAVFIPMIFMVGLWGTNAKATAVFRFFLMSFLGSILMLVSIFYLIHLYHEQSGHYSSNLLDLMSVKREHLKWCFWGFFLAFAIKVPVFPFHGWLKDVYTAAPMPATIWMSAILSKLGVFGFIRFVLPLFEEVAKENQGMLLTLAAVSVVYAAFLAIRSDDAKTLLAYSSISHLGFVMLGVFSMSRGGTASAILLSVGHTMVSAILFYVLHLIEERKEHLGLETSHGLARSYPVLFTVFFIGVLASVSLPGTLNFAGEFLVLLHSYSVSVFCTVLAGLGMILGAVYMLKLYQKLGFGSVSGKAGTSEATKDVTGYDLIVLSVLLIGLIYFGFHPGIFLKGN